MSIGSNVIPLPSIVQFIHLCYQVDCLEAFSILADTALQLIGAKATSIKIVLAVDELRDLSKQGTEEKKSQYDLLVLVMMIWYISLGEECHSIGPSVYCMR